MNQRLQQFLTAENISQSQFADTIGVARASISHIISGRNKPGFDFIESMARKYPALSLEWLITGRGRMYKGTADSQNAGATSALQQQQSPLSAQQPESDRAATQSDGDGLFGAAEAQIQPQQQPQMQFQSPAGQRISKILVLYTDGTFQELK